MKIKELKKEFPEGTYFLSATEAIKTPLRVTKIVEARHEDRQNRIRELEREIINRYNEVHDTNHTTFYNVSGYMIGCDEQVREISEIKKMPKDIVEVSGGVIYCGETNKIAKKC